MVKVYPLKVDEVEVNTLGLAYMTCELELAIKSSIDPCLVSDDEFVGEAMQRVLKVDHVLQKIKLAIKQ